MKKSIKIKNFLYKSSIYPHSNYFSKRYHIAILRYHSVQNGGNNDYVSPNITMDVDVFERQIKHFSKKYNIITMDEAVECFQNCHRLPKRAMAITFDDGYRDNYVAYRIMRKYRVSGAFYVVAGCIGEGEPLWLFEIIYLIKNTKKKILSLDVSDKLMTLSINSTDDKAFAIRKITETIKSNNRVVRETIRKQLRSQLSDVTGLAKRASQIMLSWEHLREMSANGMIIGGHTMTHLNLPNADLYDACREINDCKQLLEEKLQKPVLHFSYPNGGNYAYYNQTIVNMVKEAGYLTSTTSNNGLADLNSNEYELHRIRVTPNLSEIHYQIEWEPILNKLMKNR